GQLISGIVVIGGDLYIDCIQGTAVGVGDGNGFYHRDGFPWTVYLITCGIYDRGLVTVIGIIPKVQISPTVQVAIGVGEHDGTPIGICGIVYSSTRVPIADRGVNGIVQTVVIAVQSRKGQGRFHGIGYSVTVTVGIQIIGYPIPICINGYKPTSIGIVDSIVIPIVA